jgi:hypothetical protein
VLLAGGLDALAAPLDEPQAATNPDDSTTIPHPHSERRNNVFLGSRVIGTYY